MKMSDRINLLLAQRKMNHADLASAIGVSRQAVQKWASGASEPKGTNLIKICQFFEVTTEWMQGNEDSSLKKLDAQPVGVFVDGDPIPDGYVAIPEFNVDFGAGACSPPTWEECQESQKALYRMEFFQHHQISPKQCKRIKVVGESMEPTLYHGDTVLIVERHERIVDGAIYAFSLRDDLMIKRLYKKADGSIVIHSDNSERFEDEIISPERQEQDHFRIYGRAIERSGSL